MISNVPSIFSENEAYTIVKSAASTQRAAQEHKAVDALEDDSDDDLDTALAKAALDIGTKLSKRNNGRRPILFFRKLYEYCSSFRSNDEHSMTSSVCSINLLSMHITYKSLRMPKKLL